jgi:light-regulated signal transduction histidine kinase (bacteriophytochrome)
MDGFSQALLEDYGDRLDTQGKEYLDRVRKASQRMGQLIDDLLKLSRITRAEMHMEEVDLSALAAEITDECRRTEPDRSVEVSIKPGMKARVDARLVRILLTNLIGNAWKFTGKTIKARIEFGVEVEEGRPVFHVRDNGAGFDMTYADKLFGAFQRLHGANEFEGTGIGLATSQRIVHRHGGRIWAEGETGRGATFRFQFE